MTIEEIRKSGLLEAFIIGNLSDQQEAELSDYLEKYPDLKSDLKEIENALRAFAELKGIKPSPALRQKIIESIVSPEHPAPTTEKKVKRRKGPFFLPAILMMILLGICWFWANQQSKELRQVRESQEFLFAECDSIELQNELLNSIINNIYDERSKKVRISPTDSYANTSLDLYSIEATSSNYIKANSLPLLASDEVFQLWSLKDGQAPIPLTTFGQLKNQILEVDFEVGTNFYAITIEKSGGSLKPDLSRLIGTLQV